MSHQIETVQYSLTISGELDQRLAQLALEGNTTKAHVLSKAVALYDVVSEARQQNKYLGILNSDKQIETEIIGI